MNGPESHIHTPNFQQHCLILLQTNMMPSEKHTIIMQEFDMQWLSGGQESNVHEWHICINGIFIYLEPHKKWHHWGKKGNEHHHLFSI